MIVPNYFEIGIGLFEAENGSGEEIGVFWQLKYWYWQSFYATLKLYRRNLDENSITSKFGFRWVQIT
jgi:hypothetical protein